MLRLTHFVMSSSRFRWQFNNFIRVHWRTVAATRFRSNPFRLAPPAQDPLRRVTSLWDARPLAAVTPIPPRRRAVSCAPRPSVVVAVDGRELMFGAILRYTLSGHWVTIPRRTARWQSRSMPHAKNSGARQDLLHLSREGAGNWRALRVFRIPQIAAVKAR